MGHVADGGEAERVARGGQTKWGLVPPSRAAPIVSLMGAPSASPVVTDAEQSICGDTFEVVVMPMWREERA